MQTTEDAINFITEVRDLCEAQFDPSPEAHAFMLKFEGAIGILKLATASPISKSKDTTSLNEVLLALQSTNEYYYTTVDTIKSLRNKLGVSLAVGKKLADALQDGGVDAAMAVWMTMNQSTKPSGVLTDLAYQVAENHQGKSTFKIVEWVKQVRTITGWDLYDSKKFVDNIRNYGATKALEILNEA